MTEETSFENLFEAALTELNNTADQPTDVAPIEGQAVEAQVEGGENTPDTETVGETVANTEDVAETVENNDAEKALSPIVVTEADTIALPDGTEILVKEAVLRQADYTRKTQALAEERKSFDAQRTAVSSQVEYVENLTKAWQTNQAEVVSGFVASTEDPTLTISQVIVELAKTNKLDPKFLETFGITPEIQEKWVGDVKSQSELAEVKARLNKFEQDRSAQEAAATAKAQEEALISGYDDQWAQIKTTHNLTFDATQEVEAKLEVLRYALDNDITNLKTAYNALQFEKSKTAATTAKKAVVNAKKEATGAITAKSTGGSVVGNRQPNSIEDAAWAAFQELTSKQSLLFN